LASTNRSTWRFKPKEHHQKYQRRENFKSHMDKPFDSSTFSILEQGILFRQVHKIKLCVDIELLASLLSAFLQSFTVIFNLVYNITYPKLPVSSHPILCLIVDASNDWINN
jgi:hypothetical protein